MIPDQTHFVQTLPFTFIAKPFPAHEGRRNASVKLFGRSSVNFKVAASPSGKVVCHVYGRARGFPGRRRRYVYIHPKTIARLVIDSITVESMTFHPTADTAGKAAKHVLVFMPHTRPTGTM